MIKQSPNKFALKTAIKTINETRVSDREAQTHLDLDSGKDTKIKKNQMENSVVEWTENWTVNQTKIGWKTGQITIWIGRYITR